jgi:membrane AbrB-like protein
MLLTLAVAGVGGAAFALLGVPLAWMLGAMAASGALAWHERAEVAAPIRPVGLIFLGLGLGQTFTPPVMAAVGQAVGWLVLAAVLSLLAGALTANLFARMARTDDQTGYYASVPGGVVVMAVLAQRAGVSVPSITLAQTIRVMVVVVVVPPLVTWLAPHGSDPDFLAVRGPTWLPGLLAMAAGGLVAGLLLRRLGIANPWMLGPCIMTAALGALWGLPSGVPAWMVNLAQVALGMSLGARITRRFILSSRRLAVASAVTALLLCALMAAVAGGFAWASGLPFAAAVLGLAPGGMPEMTITAKTLEVAVPLVLGFHIVRMLLCNVAVEPFWRLAVRLRLLRAS